jgi:acyl-CoA thioester hydrolase
MTQTANDPIYRHKLTVSLQDLDQNGHVNNVQYVRWMQEIAIAHYEQIGGLTPTQAHGATWVVRSHNIEYFHPAFLKDEIEICTWVVNIRRVRSLRRYEFTRTADNQLLAKGETDWVFVDLSAGRPMVIPKEVARVFTLLNSDKVG